MIAENERMHLMTFLEVRGAGIFMRLSVAAVQVCRSSLFVVSLIVFRFRSLVTSARLALRDRTTDEQYTLKS